MEPVWGLAQTRSEIEGLAAAYPAQTDMLPEVQDRYARAWAEHARYLTEAKKRAQMLFEGALKEHEQRKAKAVRMGRNILGEKKGGRAFIVGGVARASPMTGAIEPLPGLKMATDVPEQEILDCIRKLAGQPQRDDDMDADAFLARKPDWLKTEGGSDVSDT